MTKAEILSIISIVFGWLTFVLVCAYSIPQFVKIVKTKNTSSNSVIVFSGFILSSMFSLLLAIGNILVLMESEQKPETWWCVLVLLPSVLFNSLNIGLNIASLIIKVRHIKQCKKLKIDEIELAKRLLAAKKGAK